MSNISATESTHYDAVCEYLLQADEKIIYRALPCQIADALGLNTRPTLEALVEAMFAGSAVLHWELVCPECGGRGEQHDWLRHAQHEAYCRNCKQDFTVHLDSEAQATFSPHPTLRELGPQADDREFQQNLHQAFPPTTVHELLTIQSFSDWAREQPLPEGEHLEVTRVVIWFSDLAGSTALYEKTGDPLGYRLVREHFDLLFDAIHLSAGAVVKTTGDGVMAVFLAGEHALQAALAAHQTLEKYNLRRTLSEDRQLHLKIGIHAGPVIAVTLNERLDYFGNAVNVASRLDDLARRQEIVLTDAVYAESGVRETIAGRAIESFETPIRGLSRSLTAYRLQVA